MEEHICTEPGCDAMLFDDEQFCESHERDQYGVRYVDCECSMSWSDNADVEVCWHHRQVWRD